jgi:hypothetical protein
LLVLLSVNPAIAASKAVLVTIVRTSASAQE